MKKTIQKAAAAFCAVLMCYTAAFVPVRAAKDASATVLPSGLKINGFGGLNEKINEISSDAKSYASAAVGVFQGDEILYEGYFGNIDIKNNIPADENSVYDWGSISKTLIWVSVMQLWEAGKIDLEQDVRTYLPEGFFQHLSYDEPITMLNLMNHNAGWQESVEPMFVPAEKLLPLKDALQAFEPAQTYPPGEVMAYSNYGAAVAGYVVECITGEDYCSYVHTHIFEPLGMEHTALNPTHTDNEWVCNALAKRRSYKKNAFDLLDLGDDLGYIPLYPAGSAVGTLTDLMTYAQALVNDDAPLFQHPETHKELFAATEYYGNSEIPLCAHGFWTNEYAVTAYGHNGSTNAGVADMEFDRASKTGVVIMQNEQGNNAFMSNIPSWVFGTLRKERFGGETAEPAQLGKYYLGLRSTYQGIMKACSIFSILNLGEADAVEKIGDGVFQVVVGTGESESAMLIGEKPNGYLQMMSMELKPEPHFLCELVLFAAYILAAVASVRMLLYQLQLRKHGKTKEFRDIPIVAASSAASVISVLTILTAIALREENYGISANGCIVVGVTEIVCGCICAAALLTAVISLCTKKEKGRMIRNILSIASNGITVAGIVFFEMYHFWNI